MLKLGVGAFVRSNFVRRTADFPPPARCEGMSKKEEIEMRTWGLLGSVCDAAGMRAVDAEYVREGGEYYLRCYIDREGGVRIEDCEAVSRALDPMLDEEDFIPDAYTLEVSSPGLGRQLRRPNDFAFAAGKQVELKTFRAVDGKKAFSGILTSYDDASVTIGGEDGERTFPRKDLALIRLAFDI